MGCFSMSMKTAVPGFLILTSLSFRITLLDKNCNTYRDRLQAVHPILYSIQ